jgi:hypothetical protein
VPKEWIFQDEGYSGASIRSGSGLGGGGTHRSGADSFTGSAEPEVRIPSPASGRVLEARR